MVKPMEKTDTDYKPWTWKILAEVFKMRRNRDVPHLMKYQFRNKF